MPQLAHGACMGSIVIHTAYRVTEIDFEFAPTITPGLSAGFLMLRRVRIEDVESAPWSEPRFTHSLLVRNLP
jgi:hypothetical protein